MYSTRKTVLLFLCCAAAFLPAKAGRYKAHNMEELNQLKQRLQPGDTLVLANGNWANAHIWISNKGTAQSPIVVMAEKPGDVLLTGNSRLGIGGAYIEVNGLAFTQGHAGGQPVIAFRDSANYPANNCRVTNCVIDNYTIPGRLNEDNWVKLYGKQNRFDHNYLSNKKNAGTVLVVELNDIRHQQNGHRIDHNFFGTRERLGSNGGETIRIGNSTFSRTSSGTIIEENYFFHCNGEVEIISVKSCDNILRRNTLYECEGGLVLRHGNRNTVEENFFIGNHKEHTGGVRIINAGHKILRNFFYQLGGERFRAALVVMNGVPNSPINRYDPVKDVTIEGNTFIDCDNLELCAGRDGERTARPENVTFTGNTFYRSAGKMSFMINDTTDGIRFSKNYANFKIPGLPAGGFLPAQAQQYRQPVATAENTGAQWYRWRAYPPPRRAQTTPVPPGENTLYEKALQAKEGDTLVLQNGEYRLSKAIAINYSLTVKGPDDGNRPVIQFSGEQGGFSFFSIEQGGNLYLSGIRFNGLSANGMAESFIRTGTSSVPEHYKLFVDRCDFMNITDGRKHALKVDKGSFADTIRFTNCSFNDISGEVLSIAAEKEDKGIYNAEHVILRNCVFNKILLGAIDLYRGGNDESTTGPSFIMDHCTFNQVGNVELCSVVRLMGVQYSVITNCIFNNSGSSGRAVLYEDYGWTKNRISYCNSFRAGKIASFYNNITGGGMITTDPMFENTQQADLRLKPASPLKNKGSDGRDIGALWKNGQLAL